MTYTDYQIKFIKDLKENGLSWKDIADKFNEAFNETKTPKAMERAFDRHKDTDFSSDAVLKNMEAARKKAQENQRLKKEHTIILDSRITSSDVAQQVKAYIDEKVTQKIRIRKPPKKVSGKSHIVLEALLSDIHAGKISSTFNSIILRDRMVEFTSVLLGELGRYSKLYNVDGLVLAILGDLLENSHFHGVESMSACEYQNSEQIRYIIEILFEEVIVPLAATGLPIKVPCVTGNHDRYSKDKTYNEPGKNHLSWIIYNTLKFLSEKMGLNNLKFDIPEGVFTTVEIYGKTVLYEHGDNISKFDEASMEKHIHKRATQLGKIVDYMRIGHFHKHVNYNRGRIIVNGPVCGIDSYAEVKGFSGAPCQVINFYIKSSRRSDPFYHSFPVNLELE